MAARPAVPQPPPEPGAAPAGDAWETFEAAAAEPPTAAELAILDVVLAETSEVPLARLARAAAGGGPVVAASAAGQQPASSGGAGSAGSATTGGARGPEFEAAVVAENIADLPAVKRGWSQAQWEAHDAGNVPGLSAKMYKIADKFTTGKLVSPSLSTLSLYLCTVSLCTVSPSRTQGTCPNNGLRQRSTSFPAGELDAERRVAHQEPPSGRS
jgi:hypothetical protein